MVHSINRRIEVLLLPFSFLFLLFVSVVYGNEKCGLEKIQVIFFSLDVRLSSKFWGWESGFIIFYVRVFAFMWSLRSCALSFSFLGIRREVERIIFNGRTDC